MNKNERYRQRNIKNLFSELQNIQNNPKYRYEFNIQLWKNKNGTEQTTIYICKEDVDLYSYGASDTLEVLEKIVNWIRRVNKQPPYIRI